MSKEHIIAGLDIGSYKIRAVISVYDEEKKKNQIIGIGNCFSKGIRKGKIIDQKELTENINIALEEAENMSGIPIQAIFISVNSNLVEIIDSKGVINLNGQEIGEEEIKNVLNSSVINQNNQNILDIFPIFYNLDGNSPIINPKGMTGNRLEVDAKIINCTQNISEIKKIINNIGIEVLGEVPTSIASAFGVLDKNKKEIGTINIDIGASCTGFSIFEESVLIHSGSVPLGGENVSNDIAIGLRVSTDISEKIKIKYGDLLEEEISETEEIQFSEFSNEDGAFMKKYLSQIAKARYQEIFYLIKMELKKIGRDGMLPGGVVLSGGGVKIKGIKEIAKKILSLPVEIAIPNIASNTEKIQDPEYGVLVGITKYGIKKLSSLGGNSLNFDFFKPILKWLKNILPN